MMRTLQFVLFIGFFAAHGFAQNSAGGNGSVNGAGTISAPLGHSVTLSWTASSSSGVTGYNIYRAQTSGGSYSKLNTSVVTGTSYLDNTVIAGQTYYYVSTAVASGGTKSAYSNQATATVPTP